MRYEGEFRNGLPNGLGELTDYKGNTYVGNFKNGLYHGLGTLTVINGSLGVGVYADD